MFANVKNIVTSLFVGTPEEKTYEGRYLDAFHALVLEAQDMKQPANSCDLSTYLKDVKVFTAKKSVSETTIITADLPHLPAEVHRKLSHLHSNDADSFSKVSLKVRYPLKDPLDNSLNVENQIIRESFVELINKHHTPNVIGYLQTISCEKKLSLGADQQTYDNYVKTTIDHKKVKNLNQAEAFIMERIESGSMYKVLTAESKTIEFEEVLNILLQMYYTLACLARKGIRHNDLHMENILVRKLEKPEEIVYTFNTIKKQGSVYIETPETQTITIHTRYLVKMYDMDRGSVYRKFVERNVLADDDFYCIENGACNIPNDKFDVAGFNMSFANVMTELRWNKNSERVSLFQFLISAIGQSNYDQFHALPFSQIWMRHPGKQISLVQTPIVCLNLLVQEFSANLKRYKPHPNSIPYKLPPHLLLHVTQPTEDMLNHYQNISEEVLTKFKSHSDYVFSWKMKTAIAQLIGRESIGRFIELWLKELQFDQTLLSDKRDMSWETAAASLYLAFSQHTGKYPVSDEFILACLTLTCPMYYGIPEKMRQLIINDWMDSSTGYKGVYACELLIWKKFANKLPVNILALYNIHSNIETERVMKRSAKKPQEITPVKTKKQLGPKTPNTRSRVKPREVTPVKQKTKQSVKNTRQKTANKRSSAKTPEGEVPHQLAGMKNWAYGPKKNKSPAAAPVVVRELRNRKVIV